MPRFYFDHVTQNGTDIDDVGTVLPNLAAAKAEAAAAASEWMKDYVSAAGAELKLSVRDGKPGPIFVVAASIKVYIPGRRVPRQSRGMPKES